MHECVGCHKHAESVAHLTEEEQLCADIRRLQQRSGCTDVVCKEILQLFKEYAGGVKITSTMTKAFSGCDKKLQSAAGVKVLKLNGCVRCHKHVYTPDDKARVCPHCGHTRFDEEDKPNELVFYFPLKEKLEALLKLASYRKLLEHEYERPSNHNLMSDIYDSPAWKHFMGPVASPINRIGLQLCMDGIPAFASGGKSMKPLEAFLGSLPPTERHKAENMLLMMLIEDGMKHKAMKKYFDFAAKYEIKDMHDNGIVIMCIIILIITCDRDFFCL